ncbi:MAG: filament integrity protein FraC [Cyanobacteria bacterium P01_H01_bin.121]
MPDFGEWFREFGNWFNFESITLADWLVANFHLTLLPVRMAMTQVVCLLMAIAIEGVIFKQRFGITSRGAMRYAVILNLASTVVGWLLFLPLQNLLPEVWRLELMQFLLFNRFSLDQVARMNQLLVMLALGLYVGTFLLEVQVLNVVLFFQSADAKPKSEAETEQYNRERRYKASLTDQIRMNTLLVGNASSFSAILALLLLVQLLYG